MEAYTRTYDRNAEVINLVMFAIPLILAIASALIR